MQTSSKKVDVTNTDERRAYGPMTAFPEFAIPADANLIAQRSNRIVGLMRPRLRRQFGLDPQHRANAGQNRPAWASPLHSASTPFDNFFRPTGKRPGSMPACPSPGRH